MDYSCCFSLGGNLDFLDFLQKKFYNIDYCRICQSKKTTLQIGNKLTILCVTFAFGGILADKKVNIKDAPILALIHLDFERGEIWRWNLLSWQSRSWLSPAQQVPTTYTFAIYLSSIHTGAFYAVRLLVSLYQFFCVPETQQLTA